MDPSTGDFKGGRRGRLVKQVGELVERLSGNAKWMFIANVLHMEENYVFIRMESSILRSMWLSL